MKFTAKALLVSTCMTLSAVSFGAQTLTIATVNNSDMIRMQKLSKTFEAEHPEIKLNWVVLEDDKHEQPAQNLVPLIHKGAVSPKVEEVLNNVSAHLTTQDIIQLNKQVDVDHKDPAKVAEQWVKDKLAAK